MPGLWARLEHSRFAKALNVEDSSSPDLCAEVSVLDSSDIPLVPKAQGLDNSLSQDLDLAKRSLKDGSLAPRSLNKPSTISIVNNLSSAAFDDVSLTPPDDGGMFDGRGITNLSSVRRGSAYFNCSRLDLTSTDLCAEESIGHDDSIRVKRLDKPKVKCASGSYPVKLPLKDDSLTPLSSRSLAKMLLKDFIAQLDYGKIEPREAQGKLDKIIASMIPLDPTLSEAWCIS